MTLDFWGTTHLSDDQWGDNEAAAICRSLFCFKDNIHISRIISHFHCSLCYCSNLEAKDSRLAESIKWQKDSPAQHLFILYLEDSHAKARVFKFYKLSCLCCLLFTYLLDVSITQGTETDLQSCNTDVSLLDYEEKLPQKLVTYMC